MSGIAINCPVFIPNRTFARDDKCEMCGMPYDSHGHGNLRPPQPQPLEPLNRLQQAKPNAFRRSMLTSDLGRDGPHWIFKPPAPTDVDARNHNHGKGVVKWMGMSLRRKSSMKLVDVLMDKILEDIKQIAAPRQFADLFWSVTVIATVAKTASSSKVHEHLLQLLPAVNDLTETEASLVTQALSLTPGNGNDKYLADLSSKIAASASSLPPSHVALLLQALARLRFSSSSDAVIRLRDRAANASGAFSGKDVARVVWALVCFCSAHRGSQQAAPAAAQLDSSDPDKTAKLLASVAGRLLEGGLAEELGCTEVAMLFWSLGQVGEEALGVGLRDRLVGRGQELVGEYSADEVADILGGMGRARAGGVGGDFGEKLKQRALGLIPSMQAREISRTMRAVAEQGIRSKTDEELYEGLKKQAGKTAQGFTAEDITDSLWALAKSDWEV